MDGRDAGGEPGGESRGRERRRRVAAAAGLLALAVAASCIVFTGRTGDSIRFPEAAHAELMGDCDACHDGIAGHQVDSTTRRALEAKCIACHEAKRDDCAFCHSDVANAGVLPERDRALHFSHETHLERTSGDCAVCHAGAHGMQGATSGNGAGAAALAAAPTGHPGVLASAMPAHPECFSCHEMQEFYDQLDCKSCHQDLARYGLLPYESFTHSNDFVGRGHGELLRDSGSAAVCAQCHEASSCDDCHFANGGFAALRLTPAARLPEKAHLGLIHRGDYLLRHPWEARADSASCVKCHSPDYCLECHEERGLAQEAALTRTDGFQFHGPGVLFKGSPEYHGTAARRDPLSCAACHDDGSRGNCTDCHAEGAFGGNPHPPHWKSRLDKRGAAVCRLCHAK